MGFHWGSVPLILYPSSGGPQIPPGIEFFLLTDLTFFLLTDGTQMELAH